MRVTHNGRGAKHGRHHTTRGAARAAAPGLARAQGPPGPLRLVVPFAPGETSDILARILAPQVSQRLEGRAVVVENRTGAAGNLSAELVARSAPDGSATLITDVGVLATAPALFGRLWFDPRRDLAPVTMLIYAPHILAVHPSVPARTAAELAELARRQPPALNVANSGVGAANHLTALLLAQHWGLGGSGEPTQVPYRGGAAALTAVAGGEAQLLINGATATAPFVRDGRLRGLAVSGPRRLPDLPDLPTFAELGWPAPDSGTWQGVLTAGPTPEPVVARIEGAFRGALADPAIARRMAELGADIRAEGPASFRRWLEAETEAWGRVVRANTIRLD